MVNDWNRLSLDSTSQRFRFHPIEGIEVEGMDMESQAIAAVLTGIFDPYAHFFSVFRSLLKPELSFQKYSQHLRQYEKEAALHKSGEGFIPVSPLYFASRLSESALNREHFAANPHTHPLSLFHLAHDTASNVRVAVAHNPKTPVSALLRLTQDSLVVVASSAWSNPNLPPSLLAAKGADPHFRYVYALARNPSTPTKTLHELCQRESGYTYLHTLLRKNPNSSQETQDLLSKLATRRSLFEV